MYSLLKLGSKLYNCEEEGRNMLFIMGGLPFFVTIKMTFVTQNVWGAQGEKEDLGKKPQG